MMTDKNKPSYQKQFWDEEAPTAEFSHPVNRRWIERIAGPTTPILDYGCGYGRTISDLLEIGLQNVVGVDVSERMLDRARATHPETSFVLSDGQSSPLTNESFQLVLLFAVLTSIPSDEDQEAVISDVRRLIRPGGHLYVSDLPIQTDARRVARYLSARPKGLPHGTFEIDGGRAVMRHHSADHFDTLFDRFEMIEVDHIEVSTMRGMKADAVQYLLRKPIS